MGMTSQEAVEVIAKHREDSIVVSTMTAMFHLHATSPSPLNIDSVPLMGGASGLGLGLALARPERSVFVLDGDGSLLMQLGSLATIAGAKPRNLFHFVFNNNVWFEGLTNLSIPGQEEVDFELMAKAAGYAATYSFDGPEQLHASMSSIIDGPSPAFIHLAIASQGSRISKQHPQPELPDLQFERMGKQVQVLKAALNA